MSTKRIIRINNTGKVLRIGAYAVLIFLACCSALAIAFMLQ